MNVPLLHLDDRTPYISIKQHILNTSVGLMIETPKTVNSIRNIPLLPELVERLNELKGDKEKGLIFQTSKSNPIHPRCYQRSFDMLLERAGLISKDIPKPRIHDLRHGFATQLIKNGVDIKTVSLLLGHSNVNFTANTYVHPNLESMKAAVNSLIQ